MIGSKEWEKWVCPDPDEIISQPDFWSTLQKDPKICEKDETVCWDEDEIQESAFEESPPRRRLLAVSVPTPPTGNLDKVNLAKYDLTSQKIPILNYKSREGLYLWADPRSIRKIIYAHSHHLGLSFLGNRIPCPIQKDPSKFQRTDCWAVTDRSVKDAVLKIFEYTTFMDSNIITAQMPMHDCPKMTGTYFIDETTGTSMYFLKGGKQDGKL